MASLKKHLEGWQPALLTITIALGTAVVVVPRPVVPQNVPLPIVEPREAELVLARDAELARSVETNRPDGHVRRLGSAIRAYGTCEASRDKGCLKDAKSVVDAAAQGIHSLDAVICLRAYQTETFLKDVRAWVASGKPSRDLDELGGGFRELLRQNEWLDDDQGRPVILPDGLVLRAMYKKRWNDVVGANREELELSRTEARALNGFLLAHPPLPPGAAGSGVSAAAFQEQSRLKKIDDLLKLDATYPATYARGIVYYQLGAYQLAVKSFGRYIEETPSGPYALRAGNYMRASLDHAELE